MRALSVSTVYFDLAGHTWLRIRLLFAGLVFLPQPAHPDPAPKIVVSQIRPHLAQTWRYCGPPRHARSGYALLIQTISAAEGNSGQKPKPSFIALFASILDALNRCFCIPSSLVLSHSVVRSFPSASRSFFSSLSVGFFSPIVFPIAFYFVSLIPDSK